MLRLALHWQILLGMLLGAAVGIGLNVSSSGRESTVPKSALSAGVESVRIVDSSDRITIEVEGEHARSVVVDPTRETPDAPATLEELRKRDAQAAEWFEAHGRSTARRVGDVANWLGGLFLRMLRMVSLPLVVASLASGMMGLGAAAQLGRMFSRTLVYYLSTSMLAIVIGLVLVNAIRPGLRGKSMSAVRATPAVASTGIGHEVAKQIETLIPTNPIQALAEGNFLSVISFTLLFSAAATMVGGATLTRLRELADASFEAMMKLTMGIIQLAPLGVLCLMLYVTATQGPAVFRSLFLYMLTVVLALGMHAFVALPLIIWLVARRSPLQFARAMSPALLTAFSSASSNGTLPLTMACAEQGAGIRNRVTSFVLPLGATVNMDGTALYEAVAVLFIGQLYHGANLDLSQQLVIAFTALVASVGAAGIPHAGLVMMTIILQAVRLPLELQGVILAVDRVLDMCRTSVNVWSDSVGCAVIDRLVPEGPAEKEPSASS